LSIRGDDDDDDDDDEIALNGDLNKPFMPKTLHIKHLCINKITFPFLLSPLAG
jgi:hypothetical protein